MSVAVHATLYAVVHDAVPAVVAHPSHSSELPGAQLPRHSALSRVQLLGPSAGLPALLLLPANLSPLVRSLVCVFVSADPLQCLATVLLGSSPRLLGSSATPVVHLWRSTTPALDLFNLGRSPLSQRSATVALWRSMDISRGPLHFSLLAPSFFLLTPSLLSLTLSLLSPKLLLLLRRYISSSQLIYCMLFVARRCQDQPPLELRHPGA